MKTKRTKLISTETHEALIIRLNVRAQRCFAPVWCEECAAEALLLTPDEAAALAGLSVRAIYRMIEEKQIHFKETPDGPLLVCLRNLQERTS